MAENISLSDIIPAPPARVFAAWLDADEHGKMTGSTATDEGDGQFTAWDGYIAGRTVASEPHTRIVQEWRTTEFPDDAPFSKLTLTFAAEGEGTKLTIEHADIPTGQGEAYLEGWKEYYFEPMKKYFGSPMEKVREAGEQALEAVDAARASARRQAVKTVEAVRKVEKKVVARLKAVSRDVRKKVKALVSGKKKARPALKKKPKRVVAKKAPARKPAKQAKAPAKKKK